LRQLPLLRATRFSLELGLGEGFSVGALSSLPEGTFFYLRQLIRRLELCAFQNETGLYVPFLFRLLFFYAVVLVSDKGSSLLPLRFRFSLTSVLSLLTSSLFYGAVHCLGPTGLSSGGPFYFAPQDAALALFLLFSELC